jgi:hypothetical protein
MMPSRSDDELALVGGVEVRHLRRSYPVAVAVAAVAAVAIGHQLARAATIRAYRSTKVF